MMRVWLIAGILCLLYYGVIALYAGPDADFAWFWIVLGAVFFLFYGRDRSLLIQRNFVPEALHKAAAVVVCAGLLTIAAFCIPVIKDMRLPDPQGADYIIVLGAQVKGTLPSRALKKRLDKALLCAEKIPEARLVLSGGQGSGEDITEAECMRRYLTEHALAGSRLVLEDRSHTTRENLTFSDRITGCSQKKCAVLSNDFHIYRSLLTARSEGYTNVTGIPAEGDAVMELHYIVREAVALIVWHMKGLMA